MGSAQSSAAGGAVGCSNGGCIWRKLLRLGPAAPTELRDKSTMGFLHTFGGAPTVLAVAPGRAEVLGNHTDYNEGFILSAAIDRYVVLAARPAPVERGSRCRLASEAFPNSVVEFDAALQPEAFEKRNKQSGANAWANYIIGVVSELRTLGSKISGFDAYVVSSVPAGAGVSSSAALEMATMKMLAHLFADAKKLPQLEQIKVAKAAENNFVGMGCGILDQFSSGMGQAGSLIYLDCRTLEHSCVPFQGAQFVLANTNAPHALVDGQYNELRRHCFEAKDAIKDASGKADITHLRDVDKKLLEAHAHKLTKDQKLRSTHIVDENDRVKAGVEACSVDDMETLGRLMSASHASSRDSFGNSSRELDIMQECAQGIEGHLGSRLMGGGFGGSTINLVKDGKVEAFVAELEKRYKAKTGLDATMLVCNTGDGAFVEPL